ncbi:hypothetical protein SASPL_130106 [Salvia splendens]|uniref:Uncharacterized protein n=1 Tax=Salvia splendens TaxID=180675 RepID=A0A8X8X5H0_SALSN|nr:hypothetical protein SASPL_130106 [Salvia splendens]
MIQALFLSLIDEDDLFSVLRILESGTLALERRSLRESIGIYAVIVNHVILLHPSESVSRLGVELLSRARRSGCARANVEVPVVSGERSVCPVGLHAAALRGPVVRVPEAAVYPHRLVGGEGHARATVVVEYSYGAIIH